MFDGPAFADLPVLGVGASLSLASSPDPLTLASAAEGPDFVEYAGFVDVARVKCHVEPLLQAGVPVLFHPSYINFCGTYGNDRAWLKATADHIATVKSPWFAQDCAYCFWQGGTGYSGQLGYFVPPIFSRASLDLAIERVEEVKQQVPVPVAIEPPPLTFVVGDMPLFEFFGELAERTDAALLLDMGHLVSYEMASGRQIQSMLSALPTDRVIEVHVAGGKLRQGQAGQVYVDAHESPILEQTWQMFDSMLPELPNVKAVCLECEGVPEDKVMPLLAQIRQMTIAHSASKTLVKKVQQVS